MNEGINGMFVISQEYDDKNRKDLTKNIIFDEWNILSENDMLVWLQTIINQIQLSHEFSLGQPKEQCVCLSKNEDIWEVYIVERGIIFDKSTHEELFDACVEVIHQLADSEKLFEQQKEIFSKVKKNDFIKK